MKLGDEYFEAYVDPHAGTVEVDLWVVTALRGGIVYACRKNKFTWVKVSKTSGDYGWSRTLGAYDRRSFPEGSPPADWARTKAAAYGKALPEVEAAIKRLTKLRAQITGQRTKTRARAKPCQNLAREDAQRRATPNPPPSIPHGEKL